MKTAYKIFYLVLPLVLAAGACSDRNVLEPQEQPVSDPDSPIVASVTGTKGVDPLTTATLTDFDMSAIWNFNGTSANTWYIKGQKVTKPATVWTTTPPSYWTVTGNLSFFMYVPSATENNGIQMVYPTSGMPGVSYSPSTDDIAGQVDFCVARPILNATKHIGPVPADFHHALTQIWFDVNYEGTPPSGFSVLVENIKLNNIHGSGVATFSTSEPYFEWSTSGTADTSYELKLSSSHLRNEYLPLKPAAGIPIQNTLGRLYLLPQTLDSSANIEITYSFFDTSVTPNVRKATFTKTVNIPSPSEWPANRVIRYKITVDVGVSAPISLTGYTINDWEESGNIHSDILFD